MSNHDQGSDHPEFPWLIFWVTCLAQFGVVLGLFYWLFPTQFKGELGYGWWLIPITLFCGLFVSLHEYLQHRYLMHGQPFSFLRAMREEHGRHHNATSVTASVSSSEPTAQVPVSNRYPIEEHDQDDHAKYRFYALSAYYAILLPPAIALKFFFPELPVILPMIISVTIGYTGYEAFHAWLHHASFEEYWIPRLHDSPRKWFWQYLYKPHLVHHYRQQYNLSLWGFYTVPIWDILFGTFFWIKKMPLPHSTISYDESYCAKRPVFFIRWLDQWAESRKKKELMKKKARAQAKLRSQPGSTEG